MVSSNDARSANAQAPGRPAFPPVSDKKTAQSCDQQGFRAEVRVAKSVIQHALAQLLNLRSVVNIARIDPAGFPVDEILFLAGAVGWRRIMMRPRTLGGCKTNGQ